MSATCRVENRPLAGRTEKVTVLEAGDARAEVWPGVGFNCLRWQVNGGDLLYAAPDFESNPVPTRSGVPVLFPFPNRIRAGRFVANGRAFELVRNDSTKANAIHGYAARNPWRVIDAAGGSSASVLGAFQPSLDAPATLDLWTGDYRFFLTVRLSAEALRIEARVENPGDVPLPFGLGFHPYLRLPSPGDADLLVETPARRRWELHDSLPTGRQFPAEGAYDLRKARPVAGLSLDDVYTDLAAAPADAEGLRYLGKVASLRRPEAVEVWASRSFREVVIFTPVHRNAVCIEPYTCVTDAVNLEAQGFDTGWQSLVPGHVWTGVVELRYRG